MVDFMEDMLTVVHWYLDPKNHDEAAKIASKITKAPPERFGWLFTKNDNYRDPEHDAGPRTRFSATSTPCRSSASSRSRIDIRKHSDLESGEGSGRATEKIIA